MVMHAHAGSNNSYSVAGDGLVSIVGAAQADPYQPEGCLSRGKAIGLRSFVV